MGPTKVFETIYEHPESIRAQFGTSDTRNTVHGSDCVENAKKEIKFFFPDFDVEYWHQIEKNIF
jgi:nucleoside-diphosphate kinase